MGKHRKNTSKWMYWFSLAISVVIVYKILDSYTDIKSWFSNLFSVLSPFIIGIIIAYILYIPSRKFENLFNKNKLLKKHSRGISIFITYILFFILLIVGIRFLVPALTSSFQDLVSNFQSYYTSIKEQIMALPEDSILKSDRVINAINQFNNFKIEDYINMTKIGQYAQGVLSVVSSIFDVFVAFIVSVYVLLDRKRIVTGLKKFVEAVFNKKASENIAKYFNKTNEIFCKFLTSQFMDAIVVAILTSIAMSIMKIKYAVMLGVFIGIFNLIPYFGAIIAVGISGILTILTGGVSKAIEMLIVVIIIQQIDANIINPKIVGGSLKISPLLVIFAVTVGGAYFGVLGMFLAVPVAAVIKVIIDDFVELRTKEKNETESEKFSEHSLD